jgi:type IV secretory pathway VirB10-like protein
LTARAGHGEIEDVTQGNKLMPSSKFFTLRALACGALLLGALAPAYAQYSWIDANGMRVFSDRPPPPDTPAARILKAPRAAQAASYGAPTPEPAPAPAEPTRPAAPSVAEREADYQKRTAQQKEDKAKADKKTQQETAKAERCKGLKRNEATLQAGGRITEVNDKGERGYMSDEDRARRLAETQRMQAAECR